MKEMFKIIYIIQKGTNPYVQNHSLWQLLYPFGILNNII